MAFRQLRKVGNSLRRFTTATGSSLEQEMLEEQQHAAGITMIFSQLEANHYIFTPLESTNDGYP